MPLDSPSLLTSFDHCSLDGFWNRDWDPIKITLNDLLLEGIREGLTSTRPDFHEAAGEKIVGIAAKREIFTDSHNVYAAAIHHAAIADVVSLAIRKSTEPPWRVPAPTRMGSHTWTPACLLSPSGTHLRRVVVATSWSDARHYEEARSWFSLGEVCAYNMPMQQAVIVLGQSKDGKRHGYWSKGFRHPVNRGLRLKRKNFTGQGFKDSWKQIFREDFDDIPTKDWLAQMIEDNVLKDVAFSVTIQVPPEPERQRIVDLAKKKLDTLYAMKEAPEPVLTGCLWPFRCAHADHCHRDQQPSPKFGFMQISRS